GARACGGVGGALAVERADQSTGRGSRSMDAAGTAKRAPQAILDGETRSTTRAGAPPTPKNTPTEERAGAHTHPEEHANREAAATSTPNAAACRHGIATLAA
ncbi:MAG: hypothetical protein OSB43_20755, partial [Nocardioides sp.]|uniref:hypothetical protein n=1 Tax=Nocardioides sp. TaxID=35761 RepID=UPI00239EB26F